MRATVLSLVLVALVAAGCASVRRGEAFEASPKIDSPELAAGARVFATHCNSCHPGGEAGLGSALNNKPLPAFMIKFQVRHGLGEMPAFDAQTISDTELEHLARYVIALRQAGPPQED